jgi:SAM-dependent methyltransferase
MATLRARTLEPRLAAVQQTHWQPTYAAHPGLYGDQPSGCREVREGSSGISTVLKLGGGHGRGALFFARNGFNNQVVDFSATALRQLSDTAAAQELRDRIAVIEHDIRVPLPVGIASADPVFAHMLLYSPAHQYYSRRMSQVWRVLRPGGVFVYTVRHTGDAHYGAGIS